VGGFSIDSNRFGNAEKKRCRIRLLIEISAFKFRTERVFGAEKSAEKTIKPKNEII